MKLSRALVYNCSSADDTCVVVELKPEELTSGKVEDLYKDIMTYVKETLLHFVGLNSLPKYTLVSAFSVVYPWRLQGFQVCFLFPSLPLG